MNIPEPKRMSEIVVGSLRLDPVHGWYFYVTCDEDLHDELRNMTGVMSILSFESGNAHVYIDPRYVAHDVFVYVGCQLTKLGKEAKLMREVDAIVKQP